MRIHRVCHLDDLYQTLEHCEPIKYTILPHFLDMAERVRHYAKHAGGTAEDSFYGTFDTRRC